MNTQKAELLSQKLDKLNDFFDITTSTVDEIKSFVDELPEVEVEETTNLEIISVSLLKQDFNFIRSTLLDTVENGKKVINKLSLEIEIEEGSSGQLISAYAELVATVNNSLKLLTGTYKDIIDMHTKLTEKKEKEDKVKVQGDVNITHNTIQASVKDIVNAMRAKE